MDDESQDSSWYSFDTAGQPRQYSDRWQLARDMPGVAQPMCKYCRENVYEFEPGQLYHGHFCLCRGAQGLVCKECIVQWAQNRPQNCSDCGGQWRNLEFIHERQSLQAFTAFHRTLLELCAQAVLLVTCSFTLMASIAGALRYARQTRLYRLDGKATAQDLSNSALAVVLAVLVHLLIIAYSFTYLTLKLTTIIANLLYSICCPFLPNSGPVVSVRVIGEGNYVVN